MAVTQAGFRFHGGNTAGYQHYPPMRSLHEEEKL